MTGAWSFGPVGSTVGMAEFADHNWIVPGRERSSFDMVHRATDLAGFEPCTVAEATDYRVQLELVAAGVEVAPIPELGATEVPAGVALVDLDVPVYRTILLVSRRASVSDAGLQRVSAAIIASAAALLPAGTSAR